MRILAAARGRVIRGLHLEHVEVADEPARPVQGRQAAAILRSMAGLRDVGVGQCPAFDEREHQDAVLRPVLDDRRADAGRGGEHRIAVLAVAVDRQQIRAVGEHPRDELAVAA